VTKCEGKFVAWYLVGGESFLQIADNSLTTLLRFPAIL
ncbi:MAG: hypothetical protein HW407_2282, partial [Bacteroidetes bacterium]|nr:hypothetical protein [Bacteroidota bacterium]